MCACVYVCVRERGEGQRRSHTHANTSSNPPTSAIHTTAAAPPPHTHSSIVSIVSCGRNTHAQVLVHGGLKRAVDAVVLVVAHVVAVQHSRHALLEERQEGVPVVGG